MLVIAYTWKVEIPRRKRLLFPPQFKCAEPLHTCEIYLFIIYLCEYFKLFIVFIIHYDY